MNAAIAVVLAYLLGSVSFAVLVTKIMGEADPRSYGSGNPGATNVLRSGNKLAALLTLVGDAAKGWLAVWLCQVYGARYGLTDGHAALVGVAAFLGHLYPVFLKFQGGKGVATALGVLIAYSAVLGVATAATWIIIAVFFRYSSLAALLAALFAIFYDGLLFGVNLQFFCVTVMSGLLIYRHKQNIANLMAGKESKIGAKKKPVDDAAQSATNI
jgi:glycerol-3-phosphate acyltransferase PlsY